MQAVDSTMFTRASYDRNKPINHYLIEHQREQEDAMVGGKNAGIGRIKDHAQPAERGDKIGRSQEETQVLLLVRCAYVRTHPSES